MARDKILRVLVSAAESRAITRRSGRLSVSEYLRALGLGHLQPDPPDTEPEPDGRASRWHTAVEGK